MKNDVDASRRRVDDRSIADVASHNVYFRPERFEIRFFSRAEVIEHANTMAVADEALSEMATDGPGASGYEISLFRHSSVVRNLQSLRFGLCVLAAILNSRNRVSRRNAKNR